VHFKPKPLADGGKGQTVHASQLAVKKKQIQKMMPAGYGDTHLAFDKAEVAAKFQKKRLQNGRQCLPNFEIAIRQRQLPEIFLISKR
jgi:hypothetical protein